MKRADRIAKAKEDLEVLHRLYKEAEKNYHEGQRRLHEAEDSYGKGDRVRVFIKCSSGCCVLHISCGHVIGPSVNDRWHIRLDTGAVVHMAPDELEYIEEKTE